MNPIQKLLLRWSDVVPQDILLQREAPGIIYKHTKVRVEKKDISISHGTLFVKCSSLGKAEIFIKKQKILDDLRGVFGSAAPRDIK